MNFYDVNEGAEDEWLQTRKYNKFHNPLEAINMAILNEFEVPYVLADIGLAFQTKSCVSMHNCENEGVGSYEYEYNESGYPTRVLVIREESNPVYYYFEYDSD
jgi:hypothetical protein